MAKPSRRNKQLTLVQDERPKMPTRAGPLKLLTEAQRVYANSIKTNTLTLVTGAAGAGKTYIALSLAADMLQDREVDRIVLVRPLVEAGEKIGALPGDLSLKLEPWALAMTDILRERLGPSYVDCLLKQDKIRVAPLTYLRGSTFKDAFVLLTEAQNCTPSQMKLFLTRIGNDAKIVVDGDPTQSDIRGANGLEDAIHRLDDLKGVGVVEFTRDDVVRSGLCQAIVERYES